MPLITGSSYEEMPDWLRGYAREAATAARNLGVRVEQPPNGAPEGTPPRVSAAPYIPYRGQRFITRNVNGVEMPTTQLEDMAIRLSQAENPLTSAIRDAQGYASGAEGNLPNHVQSYLNPGIRNLLDQIQAQGRRRMEEDISPALEAKYVRLGQHGGRGHQRAAARAARDLQSELNTSQADALEGAYGQASKGYGQDRARLLEVAQSRGELGNIMNLARQGDALAMFKAASYNRELQERPLQAAEEEFRREQKHPYDSLNFLISALNGVPTTSVMRESTNIPPAPSAPQSMRSSDYMGMLAQLAPMLRRGR